MAEFVEKRCQDMIPELEQMERIKLFDKNEIRSIAKKLKEYEYKIQRHTKCKEDYLRYIQYEMDLLKLIKQRRDKYGITQKRSVIDYAITNKMNNLYKDAICKFQDDIRFWIAYMKFCKHVHFHSNINHMLGRMLQVYRDKPKCWHIAACWELEENKNKHNARQYLLRGLQIHPDSQLLYIDAFKLELDNRLATAPNAENTENQEGNPVPATTDDSEIPLPLKTAFFIYQQAFDCVKDIKFIIKLLDITMEYDNVEQLQKRIIDDMFREYAHEPLVWDTMARRELQGLAHPGFSDTPMEVENAEQISLRDRITKCNKVYQTAVKKIKNEEIWSLYIDCLLEINRDLRSLPNFKRKLLKTALMQAHQAKKLKEEHYLHWIDILNTNGENDEGVRKKLDEVLRGATDALPNSVGIWHARLNHLLRCGLEKEAYAMFPKVTEILGEKALPLWKMRILHAQIKSSEEAEESFQAALQAHPLIARDVKPMWLEWLVLTKGIRAVRKAYESLCLQPPTSLDFHKKMITLELVQPETLPKYVRRPYEKAMMHFGTKDTSIWIDYIKYEMKHGDPKRASDIHERAVKTLDRSLTYSFLQDYSLIAAKPDSIK
ncbi:PREDICTED: U3 small nucleolar RNA-associated protein 6 homolog [Wasmannia auropunctata]|uniref:U3 small nucleolar RNA-associated protein 6 homolog n=2 Tax=Wasmannia auropunctata TaxID=64793 RepID=UPI0005EEE14E|nr:PREDICTED: U3 small nucleolar RNA-associated protein 6 homolog [Wasmannia auropunctata]XP_011686888.1 PREDICTED: U3 small nucleolar RNA-associated protein 6 homolog [Wasmannia auropunctata]